MAVSTLLSACGGGSDGGSAGNGGTTSTSGYTNRHLPQSINIDIPKTLLQASNLVGQSLREISPAVLGTDPAPTATGPAPYSTSSGAYVELRSQVNELKSRISEREIDFMGIDSVWDQMQDYCQGTPAGQACQIPAGQLTVTISDEMLASIVTSLEETAAEFGETIPAEVLDQINAELPPAGTQIPVGATTYIHDPEGIYDYSVETSGVDLEEGSGSDDYRYTIQWTKAKDKLEFSDSASETYEDYTGSYSSSLVYNSAADGDSIQFRETSTTSSFGSTWENTTRMTLKEQNNAKNGVIITADFTDNGSGYASTYHVDGQADDDGGYVKSRNSFDFGSGSDIWHYKESFDGSGSLLAAEECQELSSGYCDGDTHWTPATGYSEIPADDPYYIDDSGFDELDTEFGFVSITVSGLPNDDIAFIIARAEATEPFEGADDILCYGAKINGIAEGFCSVSEEELLATDTVIYEQDVNIADIDAGNFSLVYTAVPGASYTVIDLDSLVEPVPVALP